MATTFVRPMDYRSLVKAARASRRHAHAPYSHFRVGAALLTPSGKIFTGCNIENSSYGLTMCAERTALFKAVSEGEKKFLAIAIATDEETFIPPCGACRQVMLDLAGDVTVLLVNNRGALRTYLLADLLPHPFGPTDLTRSKKKK